MAPSRKRLAWIVALEEHLAAACDTVDFRTEYEIGCLVEYARDVVRRRKAALEDELVAFVAHRDQTEMTPNEERWAEALQVEKMFGLGAAAFVAERIATLGMMGDAAGVQRWTEIAERLRHLRSKGTPS